MHIVLRWHISYLPQMILLYENVEDMAVCLRCGGMQVCWALSGALGGGSQRMTPQLCTLALALMNASTLRKHWLQRAAKRYAVSHLFLLYYAFYFTVLCFSTALLKRSDALFLLLLKWQIILTLSCLRHDILRKLMMGKQGCAIVLFSKSKAYHSMVLSRWQQNLLAYTYFSLNASTYSYYFCNSWVTVLAFCILLVFISY